MSNVDSFDVILPLSNILTGSPAFRILKFVPVSSGRCPDTIGEPELRLLNTLP